jgi:kumamolisin
MRMRYAMLLAAVVGFVVPVNRVKAEGPKPHPYFHVLPRAVPAVTQWKTANLCQAYNFPTKLTGGGVIGIIELGGGYVQSDLDMFSQLNNIPKINVTDISVNGGTNSPGVSADVEVALDIEVAAAAYYYCTGKMPTIKVFFAPNSNASFAQVIQSAVANNCDVLSISWGLAESFWNPTEATNLDAVAAQAGASGLAIFAASGDHSSWDNSGATTVDCPACCPHIVACGGTKKTISAETVWGDGIAGDGGTGGGYSALFPKQSFQKNAPAAPAGLGRMVPDVAGAADPTTGFLIVQGGSEFQVGGTSGVAPLYAGLFATFGKKLGFVSPTLWNNPKAFYDITQGSNGDYSAKVGPDACTGLGAPNGTLISNLFIKKTVAPVYNYVTVDYNLGLNILTLSDDPKDNSVQLTLQAGRLTIQGSGNTLITYNSASSQSVSIPLATKEPLSIVGTMNQGGNNTLSMVSVTANSVSLTFGSGNDTINMAYCTVSTFFLLDGGLGTDVFAPVTTKFLGSKTVNNVP